MNDTLRRLDEAPVTMVIAIAYGTLFVLCKPFDEPEVFTRNLDEFGWASGLQVADGGAWRLLAHAFLHGSVIHLLLNLSSLIALGFALERSLGSLRYLLLYAVSALGGGLATSLFNPPNQPVLGGSGALFGMVGAAIALNMRSGRHLLDFLAFDGPRRLLGLTALYLAVGIFLPGISNLGHAGGLVAGFSLTFVWLVPGQITPKLRAWRAATLALLASATFAALLPVTRYDWLQRELAHAESKERAERLLRAYRLVAPRD